jgi:hypothetical protein
MEELEYIRNRKKEEQHKGDVRKACEKVGVTPPVLQLALKKNRLDDLSDKEIRVLKAYLEILNERQKEKERLKDLMNMNST